MDAANTHVNEVLEPIATLTERGTQLEVQSHTVRVHELTIERPAIVAYLEHIAPDKLEIALVHALEVGVTELVARRERFKK
jgi:hypothetical protein